MKTGPVPKILAKQKESGCWGKAEDFYISAKYKGTVWNIILLSHLGADGKDKRIKKVCEFIIEYSQDRESGGFSYRGTSGNRQVVSRAECDNCLPAILQSELKSHSARSGDSRISLTSSTTSNLIFVYDVLVIVLS